MISIDQVFSRPGLYSLLFVLFMHTAHAQTQYEWQQTSSVAGAVADGFSGNAIDLSSNGTRMIVGSPSASGWDGSSNVGRVYVYSYSDSNWEEDSFFSGGAANEYYGKSVAISADGQTIAIGAPGEINTTGRVFFYRKIQNTWWPLGNPLSGYNEGIGKAVALSADGNTVVVGKPLAGTYFPGRVQVYHYADGNWTQVGQHINGLATWNYFGTSVDISDDGQTIIAGGACMECKGRAAIFRLINNTWTQIGADLLAPSSDGETGKAVSISADGTRAAVGSSFYQGGSVHVYDITANSWSLAGPVITGTSVSESDLSLAGNGEYLAIGGANYGLWQGKASFYHYDGSAWTLLGEPLIGVHDFDFLGSAIAMSHDGSRVVIGESGFDTGALENVGRARVFGLHVYEANDAPCDAVMIPADGSVQTGFSNRYATAGPAEDEIMPITVGDCENAWCDSYTQSTVWFKFHVPASGAVAVSTCGLADFDTQIAVFSTSDCGNFDAYNLKAANDDSGLCSNFSSYLEVEGLTPGGLYYVVVDGYNDSRGLFDISISGMQSTGIQDITEQGATVTIFPNPNQGAFTLAYAALEEPAQLHILNATGQIVHEQLIDEPAGQVGLHLQHLPAGIYQVCLFNRQQLTTRKVVIE